MRKHGWQLPYHPLQVVAIAVFLALAFAFYVFFMPFVGKKVFEYVVMGIYTPLVTCVFCLYIWCAATDPGDPGVFKSAKYLKVKDSREGGFINEEHGAETVTKILDNHIKMDAMSQNSPERMERANCFLLVLFGLFPLSFISGWCCSLQQSCEQKTSEDGMFYCSLCEVEVRKDSKHCRVCDKCVDHFDHHCRWLNNCIGRKNYGGFFVLMISALLLLIIQWSIGVLVLILCFLERKRYSTEIMSKLGSSFSLAPFTVVVASCTFLAMLATLPLAQLFFFHVLLIKKGISTYDYIVALREQEHQGVGQQSPQMSSVSSLTGFSSASSYNAFQRGSWCTPPRLFLEDQFDVIPQEINIAVNSDGKKMMPNESRKRSTGNAKISSWTLARLNAEKVSEAVAQARQKSKILQPIVKQVPLGHETGGLTRSSNMVPKTTDNWKRASQRGSKLPIKLPLEPLATRDSDSNSSDLTAEASCCLAPLQLEARSAFRPIQANSTGTLASSPDSSLNSPDLHLSLSSASAGVGVGRHKVVEFSRSISDGYEASGGEDSDIVPSRIVHRSFNWSSVIFSSDRGDMPTCGRTG